MYRICKLYTTDCPSAKKRLHFSPNPSAHPQRIPSRLLSFWSLSLCSQLSSLDYFETTFNYPLSTPLARPPLLLLFFPAPPSRSNLRRDLSPPVHLSLSSLPLLPPLTFLLLLLPLSSLPQYSLYRVPCLTLALAMEGFDTMAMPPYLASPLSLGNLQGTDYLNAMPGLDLPDHRSNFDSETFVR